MIVGGGATGVELAVELVEASHVVSAYGLPNFRAERDLAITLVEGAPRILSALPEKLSLIHISLYMVFSLAPMLILVIAVAGAFFGEDAVRSELFASLRDLTGERGAEVIQTVLASAHESGGGWIRCV